MNILFGIIIGVTVSVLCREVFYTSHGSMIINLSDPEKEVYSLVLQEDIESLARRRYIRIRVVKK